MFYEEYARENLPKLKKQEIKKKQRKLKSDEKYFSKEIRKFRKLKGSFEKSYKKSIKKNSKNENQRYYNEISSDYNTIIDLLGNIETDIDETKVNFKHNLKFDKYWEPNGEWTFYYNDLRKGAKSRVEKVEEKIKETKKNYKKNLRTFLLLTNNKVSCTDPSEWSSLGNNALGEGFTNIAAYCFEKASSFETDADLNLVVKQVNALKEGKKYKDAYRVLRSGEEKVKKDIEEIEKRQRRELASNVRGIISEQEKRLVSRIEEVSSSHEREVRDLCRKMEKNVHGTLERKSKNIKNLIDSVRRKEEKQRDLIGTVESRSKQKFEIYMNLANEADILGDKERALEYCNDAINSYEKNSAAWFRKGVILKALRRHEDAYDCFRTAYKVYPLETYRAEALYMAKEIGKPLMIEIPQSKVI